MLMSLGYALTINPDDPGKFGYEDTTADYFSAFMSFKWTLKELKLLGIHSINHAICSEEEKTKLLESFNQRWNQWVNQLLATNWKIGWLFKGLYWDQIIILNQKIRKIKYINKVIKQKY